MMASTRYTVVSILGPVEVSKFWLPHFQPGDVTKIKCIHEHKIILSMACSQCRKIKINPF